jgi:hypothetical protein
VLRGRKAGIATALAIAATAAVTAGCGGGGKSALAFDPVSAAATKTQHAGAARIRFSLAFSVPQLQGKMLRMSGTGAIDGASGEMTFGMGSIFKHAGLPAGALPGKTMQQLMHASLREIFLKENDDFVIYLNLGALSSQIPGGKQWVKLDFSKLGSSQGLDFNQLLSGSQLQPTDLLSMLKTEGATVRKVGPAKVDGAVATHYHVTVDMAKALDARGVTSPMLAGVATAMPTVPEDVWIGKDGLVHRIKLSFGLEQKGRQVRMAMAMDLYDYGAHITIAAPPSSDVFDATQLAQSSFGSALLH